MANAADRKSIRESEKRAKLAERQNAEIMFGIMSTTAGRQWLWERLESLNVFGSPVGSDPHHTYFLLGEQNAGKRLMADAMQFCPDQFIQAMREANIRATVTETTDGRRSASDIDTYPDADSGTATEHAGGEGGRRDDQGRSSEGPTVEPDTGEVRY